MTESTKNAEILVLFGTRTEGPGIGFSVARFNLKTGALSKPKLVLEAPMPAYFVISRDQRRLYTCNSGDTFHGKPNGGISAYALDAPTGALTFINAVSAEGLDPSYITLDQPETHVLVANYKSGDFVIYEALADGSLGARTDFVRHTGSSIHPIRQVHPFLHSIVEDPSGRFALVADLGTDRLAVYRYDNVTGTVVLHDPPGVTIQAGDGPRHVTFHPNGRWAYLDVEMGSSVHFFEWDADAGILHPVQRCTTLPDDFDGVSTTAEIRVHPNGRFLYVTNRGLDSIAVFRIDQQTGRLELFDQSPTRGKKPRNFEFSPDGNWLIVTNHDSNNATVYALDQDSGRLTQIGEPLPMAFPYCPRFLVGEPSPTAGME
jgi:6-phosphogluconolactonase